MEPDGRPSIRRATRRDWAELRSLVLAIFPDDFPGSSLDRRLARDFRNFFVADNGERGGLIGFYSMTVNRRPTEAWLDYVGVTERARGTGLGRQLVAHFELEAGRRRFDTVALAVRKTNAPAISLYETAGYRLDGSHGRSLIYAKDAPAPPSQRKGPGRLTTASRPLRAMDRLLYHLFVQR